MTLRRHVGMLLDTFTPSPDEETHVAAMRRLLAAPGDPFSRTRFVPGHFTASGFVVSPDGRRLLLIHHRKLDIWVQPGGHIDAGDTGIAAAAAREVAEETGLADLAPLAAGLYDVDVHAVPARGGEPAHLHFDLRVLFRAGADDAPGSAEIHDLAWFPLPEAAARASDDSVRRVVAKLGG